MPKYKLQLWEIGDDLDFVDDFTSPIDAESIVDVMAKRLLQEFQNHNLKMHISQESTNCIDIDFELPLSGEV